jgi:hypothetical protein
MLAQFCSLALENLHEEVFQSLTLNEQESPFLKWCYYFFSMQRMDARSLRIGPFSPHLETGNI